MKMNLFLGFALTAACASATAIPSGAKRVSVANPAQADRVETVSVPWAKLALTPGDAAVRVWDVRADRPVPFQDDGEGNLLFSVPLSALETRLYAVFADAKLPQADLSPVCVARHVPERMDDFAWENDRFGGRAYGYTVSLPAPKGEGLVSSGIDAFNKCVPHPVMLPALPRGGYHTNYGEGMDNYKVSTGRGVGGISQYADGKWAVAANWTASRVVMTGPVRAVFELEYAPWGALGAEKRRVVLDRGKHFARFEATFANSAETLCGPGLDVSAKRGHNGAIRMDLANAWIADFEPDCGADGSILSAILLDPSAGRATLASDAMDCVHLLAAPNGQTRSVTWWAGSGWSREGRFATPCAWHKHVADFAVALRNPVKVTVK